MEKLLVAENKSYEAYRTNSNKQALSETPANGLRFAGFFNASIVSVKWLKTRQRSIRVALLGEKLQFKGDTQLIKGECVICYVSKRTNSMELIVPQLSLFR